MKNENKKYLINQSPLYKITTHKKLSSVLCVNIKTLNNILKRESENYYFSKLKNSNREIEVPLAQLRRIHSRINNLLSRIVPPEYLNSGVKGRSNISNARVHVGHTSLLKIDIASFYKSTSVNMLQKCFIKTFKCTKDVSLTLAKLCTVNGHLPTGSPISQSLAFYTNIGIFDHISNYSKSRNIKFTLYVDDLTFSGSVIPKSFLGYVKSFIEKNRNYKCHKIRSHKPDTPKIVTGAVIIDGTLKVKGSQRNTISQLLNNHKNKLNTHKNSSPELINHFQVLIGHLFSAGQINGRYYQLGKEMVSERKRLEIGSKN